jgi:hypothetical protein
MCSGTSTKVCEVSFLNMLRRGIADMNWFVACWALLEGVVLNWLKRVENDL